MDTLSEEANSIFIIVPLLIRDQFLERLPHSKQIYLKTDTFLEGSLIQGSKLEITEILSLCKMAKKVRSTTKYKSVFIHLKNHCNVLAIAI